jgi:hypothetical protein
MKCKKCDKDFKRWTLVNGKLRNLNNRKYCFDCSPFGLHNTRILTENTTNTCVLCLKKYEKGHGKNKNYCASCYVSKKRIDLKKELVDLFGGKCQICGYSKCISSLEFHHKDPLKKEISVSGSTKNKKKIIEESKKCILVCSNCHREIHHNEREKIKNNLSEGDFKHYSTTQEQ